jgi:hypothetical protein
VSFEELAIAAQPARVTIITNNGNFFMGIWVMRRRGEAASMLVLPNATDETLSLATGSPPFSFYLVCRPGQR